VSCDVKRCLCKAHGLLWARVARRYNSRGSERNATVEMHRVAKLLQIDLGNIFCRRFSSYFQRSYETRLRINCNDYHLHKAQHFISLKINPEMACTIARVRDYRVEPVVNDYHGHTVAIGHSVTSLLHWRTHAYLGVQLFYRFHL
jgi:hypothetical protein